MGQLVRNHLASLLEKTIHIPFSIWLLLTMIGRKESRLIVAGGFYQYDSQLETAMSYRVPMTVVEVVYYPSADGYYARCPRCKQTMEREYVRFCDRCGQYLDWDQYDNAYVVLGLGTGEK